MADFDNGLPPEGIDITDRSISALTIDKSGTTKATVNNISVVTIEKTEAVETSDVFTIQSVSISKASLPGTNTAMFL